MSSDAFTIPGRIELLLRNPELRAAPLRSCYCWLACNLGCWGMGHDAPLNREARWTIRLYVSPDDDALTGFELHFPISTSLAGSSPRARRTPRYERMWRSMPPLKAARPSLTNFHQPTQGEYP